MKIFEETAQCIKSYRNRNDGHFSLWFAAAAFPILLATSFAVDFRETESTRDGIKQALDASVLAAVSNNKVDALGKEKIALEVFNLHYEDDAKLELTVKVSDGRVAMNAVGTNDATLSRAVGNEGFAVDETSIAVMNRQNTICVLALANQGKHKLRFLNSTEFNSPTCSVQSNSQHAEGALSNTRHTPVAKSFCSAGGARGVFSPPIRGECRVVDDPYETRDVPNSGVCMPTGIFGLGETEALGDDEDNIFGSNFTGHEAGVKIKNLSNGKHTHPHCHDYNHAPSTGHKHPRCHQAAHKVSNKHQPLETNRLEGLGVSLSDIRRLEKDYGLQNLLTPESINYTGSNGTFYPGTYCGGLTVDGQNVTFMPGIYIIKDGSLTFKNGATAFANDVSFVLKGKESTVTVETGSYVDIKAPRNGPMAGLAFYQDRHDDSNPSDLAAAMPTGVNLISSGGELNVTGTMYFPTQALDVLGDSVLGAHAPATSFIAHQVTFAGQTKAEVSVDHIKGRIPAMLPLSDDGARLIE